MERKDNSVIDQKFAGIYKQLFEAAGEGLIISNTEGKIVLANPSANKIFGYESEHLDGMKIEDLIPNEKKDIHRAHRKNYNSRPSVRTMGAGMTLFAKKKNGDKLPVEISLNHFKHEGELFVMAMITDISKKWELDRQLHKEKETAQMYLDIASAIFLVIDRQGKVELLNRSGEELLGVKEQDILSTNWFDNFVHPKDVKLAKAFFNKAFHQENLEMHKVEFRVKTKNKGEKTISWLNSSLKNENGETRAVLCSGQDITDRIEASEKLKLYANKLEKMVEVRTKKLTEAVENLGSANKKLEEQNKEIRQAQRLLQESQELYKIIARNFPKGTISVFDKNLDYVFVEGKELYELGVTSEMLIGTNLLDRLSPEIKEDTRLALMDVLKGEAKKIEVNQKNNFYLLNAVPLKDINGDISQIMVVEQNVTESKMVEENIKNALKKERDLGELKTRFVSMASHEFRTPLSTILSSVSLIKKYLENENPEKIDKHISRIKSSVSNLTNILNDFLSLGKLEEGKISVSKERISIPQLAMEITEEMQSQAKNGQNINFQHSGESEDFEIDKGILRNIITNLLSNALKYSSENSEIRVNSEISNSNLKISVKDSGIGIPVEEQKFLFDRFFRAKNASNIQGTGLGLNIVKKYVELMGGQISFTSRPEKGTIFTVIFDQKDIDTIIEEQ
ncbi:PAS domain-containing sensor histidine kinase [Hyphobacterium sp. CCMP332]|nr:PAS domain-containing sensor histidine kinase [Hyphobacterium sp. CCMP332]